MVENSVFQSLRETLKNTGKNLKLGLFELGLGSVGITSKDLERLETKLLVSDVGIETTSAILEKLIMRHSKRAIDSSEKLRLALREDLIEILSPRQVSIDTNLASPFVVLVVGVNGSGKTTTIGKLAKYFLTKGRKVMLAAGDTYRPAASEQLHVWGERNSIPVISQHQGADSASVIFDAMKSAQARRIDVLIADTAGRLHNNDQLMEELKKIIRVMRKLDDKAPHEIMLVLDGGSGQSGLSQVREFKKDIDVTGLTLTKLDGTAKGGLIFALANIHDLPIRYIGVGEAVEDLRPFEAAEFVDALLDIDPTST